jgi:exoribonuclease R
MVSECMILANYALATFAKRHEVPIPFLQQESESSASETSNRRTFVGCVVVWRERERESVCV